MIKRKLSKELIEKEEYQVWNAFMDILSVEPEDELSEIQKHAQRAFWYDSEIQNGGHLQYFENVEMADYTKVIQSLNFIGAVHHSKILEKASKLFLSSNRKPIDNVSEFVDKAGDGEYDDLDTEYYDIDPEVFYYLQEYLKKYQDEFIEIE